MTMEAPEWLEYVIWDYSDPMNPVIKGLKKDTPKKMIKKFKEDQKEMQKALDDGVCL